MKTLRLLTVTVAAILMLSSAIRGDDATPNPPESAWELHSGTDFAAILTAETDRQPNFLFIYLRNNTSSRVQFVSSGPDLGFQFFFIDSNGISYDLHDYDPNRGSGSHWRTIIMPGEIRPFKIELTAADLALMKSTPIQCHFYTTNLTTKEKYDITTSPKTYSLPQ